MRATSRFLIVMSTLLALAAPLARAQTPRRVLVGVFAHPDDERIAAPVLARYAREGHRVHVVVVTDGRKGVTSHARVPAGDSLAAVRSAEMRCAARALGLEAPILLGLEDDALASFESLGRMKSKLRKVFGSLKPDAIVTFGPEGGTGHPDHRLVGSIVTEIVQTGGPGVPNALYYPALPAERMANAPKASPTMNAVSMQHLPVRIRFTPADFDAAHRGYACHKSQYMQAEADANMAYMRHGWGDTLYLRHWKDSTRRNELF